LFGIGIDSAAKRNGDKRSCQVDSDADTNPGLIISFFLLGSLPVRFDYTLFLLSAGNHRIILLFFLLQCQGIPGFSAAFDRVMSFLALWPHSTNP
jgi:hypothetical protein